MRPCPYCSEDIPETAILCRFCNHAVGGPVIVPARLGLSATALIAIILSVLTVVAVTAWNFNALSIH